jgi:hypothetical protein
MCGWLRSIAEINPSNYFPIGAYRLPMATVAMLSPLGRISHPAFF